MAGGPGNQPVADIATSVPKPTNGGKTYTFHIKPGVMFAPAGQPPGHLRRLRERDAAPREPEGRRPVRLLLHGHQGLVAVRGRQGEVDLGHHDCPNTSTIVFNLTAPTGDFLKRMGMPATGPQPAEVTKCFDGQAGKYGLDLISTAGYMYKGIDQVDISACCERSSRPPATTVRRRWTSSATRTTSRAPTRTRKNYVDEVRFLIDAIERRHLQQDRGRSVRLRHVSSIPNNVLKKYATTPSLKSALLPELG